jgi:hypothetical protein
LSRWSPWRRMGNQALSRQHSSKWPPPLSIKELNCTVLYTYSM